ncbi:acyl-CoA dehydrogenase family protein [Devosia nitrariae]|uniref:Acyl-CoA dehydrogenase n=1 Tax=Devosia nitrariae TaxID=2071872 RepID=A0ABQ5W676_9HYPH|nr:acyl-CoA dehydrogenase family protein [Devosia nitrariae]GLQ55383.1 acyl-CoA dehydrogenase [Devosia nitrariae]
MHAQLEDILFTLEAVGATTGPGAWNGEDARQVLEALIGFAAERLSPLDGPGDRQGCRIEDGRVRLPEGFKDAYKTYVDLGWHLLSLPEAHGGAGAPEAIGCAASELLTAGNHAFQMLVALVPGAATVIERFASANDRAGFLPDLIDGRALATMCLTEAGAGSDLGAIRTRAVPHVNGDWRISGEKIFISGGDQDLSETIVHLVLARTGALEDGWRGLSLFACPSHRPDGARNALRVLRIEDKLGLHASPTCQLRFEDAEARLISNPGEGLKVMFVMMDHARLDVAAQGVAHAARAHALASAYAGERKQGGLAIEMHGDVRRMLEEMDALALGSRAMVLRSAVHLENGPLAAFLVPVCKVFATEAATHVADLGIQVLGGYGYLREYELERIWRDARVTRLYEGTNGILSMTLLTRLVGGRDKAPLAAFLAEIDAALALPVPAEAKAPVSELQRRWQEVQSMLSAMPDAGMAASAFMRLTGLLFFSACWLRLESAAEGSAIDGRIARLARFVRAGLLPEADALAARCRALAAIQGDMADD